MTKSFTATAALTIVAAAGILGCRNEQDGRVEPTEVASALDATLVLIGDVANRSGHLLHGVTGALRTSTGRIIVANEGTRHIRIFEESGQLLAEMGGVGSGPQEFLAIQSLRPFGNDSIIAWDPLNTRFSIWSSGGEFGRTIRVTYPTVPLHEGQLSRHKAVFSLGNKKHPTSMPPWEVYTDSAELLILDLNNHASQPLGYFPAEMKVVADATALGGGANISVPLPDRPRLHVAAYGHHVYVGFSDGSPVSVYDGEGQLVGHIPVPLARRERTKEVAEGVIQEQMARAESMPRSAYRRYLATFPQPDKYPTFDLMLVGEEGTLWLREYPEWRATSAHWVALDSAGVVIGEHTLPVAFQPTQFGNDWILGRLSDEDGVEMVALVEFETFP